MIRDRKYLDSLRGERCIVTGRRGTNQESVVPAHIGTGWAEERRRRRAICGASMNS